jgi:hypothetical protein
MLKQREQVKDSSNLAGPSVPTKGGGLRPLQMLNITDQVKDSCSLASQTFRLKEGVGAFADAEAEGPVEGQQ